METREELHELHDGNLFFEHKYSSIDIAKMIDKIKTFEEFEEFYTDELIEGNVLLRRYFNKLLERRKMSSELVAMKLGFSHDYLSRMVRGNIKMKRSVLLAVCVFIHATIEETQLLLQYAGTLPLYARNKYDAIIWYALKKEQDLGDLNDYLASRKYPLLGKDE